MRIDLNKISIENIVFTQSQSWNIKVFDASLISVLYSAVVVSTGDNCTGPKSRKDFKHSFSMAIRAALMGKRFEINNNQPYWKWSMVYGFFFYYCYGFLAERSK